VACGTASGARSPLASRAATGLAGLLADVPGATTRALGRVCLVVGAQPLVLADMARHHAPLILDAGSAAVGGSSAVVADQVVLVAAPTVEPALATVVSVALDRIDIAPLVVLNRVREGGVGLWSEQASVVLPWSPLGARLALGGCGAPGRLGEAVGQLADRCAA
jgi:hypothetical protein